MKKIIPAILTRDVADLRDQLLRLEGLTDWVHVDIMDGKLVANTSISLEDISSLKIAGHFSLEAHLMVASPADYFLACQKAGVKRVIVHAEAGDVAATILELKKYHFQKALALNPKTSLASIKSYIQDFAAILVMSVEPGFGGQPFIQETLDKIRELKKLAPDVNIEVDGGINLNTIKSVADAGANYLVVGSGLFGAEDLKKRYQELQLMIR